MGKETSSYLIRASIAALSILDADRLLLQASLAQHVDVGGSRRMDCLMMHRSPGFLQTLSER